MQTRTLGTRGLTSSAIGYGAMGITMAYGSSSVADDHVKIGVLVGSLLAAVLGGLVLATRSRRARRGSSSAPTNLSTT